MRRRRPDLWLKDVVGLGSGKCNCNPPCKIDPLHEKILKDYGDLIHAKEMIYYADTLKKGLADVAPAMERYETILKKLEFFKDSKTQKGKDDYDYWFGEAKRIYKKISKHQKSFKRIEYVEKHYGWARKKVGISIQSAKGVGKTFLLAIMNMHFYSLFDNSKGIVTAPKKDLLDDNLKAEIKKWIRHSQEVWGEGSLLSQTFEITTDKMFVKLPDRSQWGNTKFLAFRTANLSAPKDVQEQTLQGYHEDYMLLGCDEASGVNDVVFKPLMTTLTGKVNIMILIFNPNRNTGFAIETQTRLKEHFLCYRISALESTLITEDHINNMRKFFENDPNGWRVSVEGLPPKEDSDALIRYEKIVEAMQRDVPESLYRNLPRVGGFDVGGGVDTSEISVIQGNKCFEIHSFNSSDPDEIERFAVRVCENELIDFLGVDGIGIGMFMPTMLKKHRINAIKVDSRNKSSDPKFYNLRTELYWRLKVWIEDEGACLPNCEILKNELAVLKKEEKGNQLFVVSKKKLKDQGIKSPNKADSLMIAMIHKSKLKIKGNVEVKHRDKYKKSSLRSQIDSWLAA